MTIVNIKPLELLIEAQTAMIEIYRFRHEYTKEIEALNELSIYLKTYIALTGNTYEGR